MVIITRSVLGGINGFKLLLSHLMQLKVTIKIKQKQKDISTVYAHTHTIDLQIDTTIDLQI